jgi:hypothetical protein
LPHWGFPQQLHTVWYSVFPQEIREVSNPSIRGSNDLKAAVVTSESSRIGWQKFHTYVVLRDSKHVRGDVSKLAGVLADTLKNRSSGGLLLDISRHYAIVQFLA